MRTPSLAANEKLIDAGEDTISGFWIVLREHETYRFRPVRNGIAEILHWKVEKVSQQVEDRKIVYSGA